MRSVAVVLLAVALLVSLAGGAVCGQEAPPAAAASAPAAAAPAEAGAAASAAPATPAPATPIPGIMPRQNASLEVTIPKDGLWRPPHGLLAVVETIRVTGREKAAQAFATTTEDPKQGQYRLRRDGALRFAREDAGKKILVTYEYQPLRVAVLPVVRDTEYEDAVPVLEEALAKELNQRGLVPVSGDRVVDALAEAGIHWPGGQIPEDLPVRVKAMAQKLDVALLIAPGVSADRESFFTGTQTFGQSSSTATTTGSVYSYGNNATVQGTTRTEGTSRQYTVPTYAHYQQVAICLFIVDGGTGNLIATPVDADSRRAAALFGNKNARRSLVRDLTAKLVKEWWESGF